MLRVAKQLESSIDSFQWNFIGGKKDQYNGLIDEFKLQEKSNQFF